MPSASARQVFEDQIPSFMSVFDLDAETMIDRDTVTVVNPQEVNFYSKTASTLGPTDHPFSRPDRNSSAPSHRHTDSNSTQMSESVDSSPTTTMSTTDSSPLSDLSPSSSPDSPTNLIPLSNYAAVSFGGLTSPSPAPLNMMNPPSSPPPMSSFSRPKTSPGPRRPRNMKGLSIQPPELTHLGSATTVISEPTSPVFIKPKIPGMKRKPSQLSLITSTSDLAHKAAGEVPPSPAMPPMLQRRALKHSTSTPLMFSGPQTSTFGPPGGMTFPKVLERNASGLSEVLRPMKSGRDAAFNPTIPEEHSSITSQMANRSESNRNDANEDDQKSPGYPDGPIAIYEDNVFLYLEPTAEEASRFDVVMNVAREVENPFEQPKQTQSTPPVPTRHFPLSPVAESPCVESATSTASFATALEVQPEDRPLETPTTPKAISLKKPEYIHMLWDHNTDIAPHLMQLCETIDQRTKEGKKVLIHCQQGASRSASLIIAYGLYQKPEQSVNDAYYAAQAKSRWISPNMKLMYSLQDFHKEMSQKSSKAGGTSRSRSSKSPAKHRLTMSADAIEVACKEPRTAPLPAEDNNGRIGSSTSPSGLRLRGNSSPMQPVLTPGPLSAPMSFLWSEAALPLMERPPIKHTADVHELSAASSPVDEPETSFRFHQLPQRPKTVQPGKRSSSSSSSWPLPPPTPGFGSFSTSGFQSLSFPPVPDAIPVPPPPSRAPPPPPPPPQRSLPGTSIVRQTIKLNPTYAEDEALMSPRLETMTNHPLRDTSGVAGLSFAKQPPPSTGNLFSPRATMFPREQMWPFTRPSPVADPRSPATKGETPIIRSIDDLL